MLSLTKDMRDEWEENGFLHLPNILSSEEINNFLNSANNVIEQYNQLSSSIDSSEKGNRVLGKHSKESYNILQVIEYSDAFDSLLDNSKIFPIILDIMGPFLQVTGCDLFVRHPITQISDLNKFHTDGGPSLQKILPQKNTPALLIKAQFFLTDLDAENSGNFTVIPGSHLKLVNYYDRNCLIKECSSYTENKLMPPEAKQIKVKAGDVVIHAWTLWHAVSPNISENTRKSISIRYGQLWSRPYFTHISSNVMQRLTKRQQRLLGNLGESSSPTEFYTPPNQNEIIFGN